MSNTSEYDVVVIGGGCVGMASAYKLNLRFPHLKIAVLEKEDRLAAHQTGRNSGVIHSGLYYKPGSYKAKNCVEGRRELVAFCKEHGVAHDVCGKIIVATDEKELPHMNRVFNNGLQNGVEGIEKINAQQIKDIEPFCAGIEGIWVPCTGIVDYVGLTNKLAELIEQQFTGSKVFTGHEVTAFVKQDGKTTVVTNKQKFTTKHLISCTGLFSDRMAKADGVNPNMQIVGFRGDYYDLTEKGMNKVRNLIYPVPNPEFPFLGVHFTRMIQHGVECGPNAVFTFKREGYGKTDFDLKDTLQALAYIGTWKLFFKHWRFGLDEYKRAFSKKLFLERLQRLIPSLEMDDITPGRAGVRAMALDANGNMIDDFKIEYSGNAIHVLNAPSPAATASLAIGTAVMEMAEKHFQIH
ncbi:MAG: L-2-hydroxyglutarate oxidase [Bacteroidetes bacterium]|nr:L-2-hydroxyglutarate oxidase [Bacteroidota bacterium]MBX7238496.1 L-2-hydroxyglutarate oxidase [Bacteroidia bacterium]MCW5919896.1 L-2-hydroxyglutarate oxidase [Bacteroidota bacterium]HMU76182.1 L-2-hydroxyglutarate oxidase [Bacteroidia bacterium]HMW08923.1 L-2-hydroxyglutarate oxidase [Bacteroidia bacterium]